MASIAPCAGASCRGNGELISPAECVPAVCEESDADYDVVCTRKDSVGSLTPRFSQGWIRGTKAQSCTRFATVIGVLLEATETARTFSLAARASRGVRVTPSAVFACCGSGLDESSDDDDARLQYQRSVPTRGEGAPLKKPRSVRLISRTVSKHPCCGALTDLRCCAGKNDGLLGKDA